MKTKRTMAGILAMAMAASALAFNPVFAAGEIGISAEKVSAKAGAEFTLAVSLKDVPSTGVGGCEFSLAYDSSIVTVTGVTAGTIAQTGADDQESAFAGEAPSFDSNFSAAGVIDVIYSTGLTDSAYMVKQDGVFLTITGTVNESAKVGDVSDFKIQPIDRETTPGSGTKNDQIVFASIAEDGTVSSYDTVVSDGSVTVVGDGEVTTATTTVSNPTTTETTTGGTVTDNIGDVNLDGVVDILDAVMLNKYLAGVVQLSDQAKRNANCDQRADSANSIGDEDTTVLMQFLLSIDDVSDLPLTE
ncbi:MAG: cohesin domain-containing protein [Ruminococcus sp.]|nr:cohesin domain-containing protein [Ruminococcus sp.]